MNQADMDQKLLEDYAKAKGLTLEEAKRLLGKQPAAVQPASPQQPVSAVSLPGDDDVVVFGGTMGTFGDDPGTQEVQIPPILESRDPVPEPEMAPEPPMADELLTEEEAAAAPLATVSHHKCVHCGWDQSYAAVPEPSHEDKLAFLSSILGQQTYKKRLTLFGDNLRMTLRTLHLREIDAIYASAHDAQRDGIIASVEDYYEYVNRMRVYLQICGLSGVKHTLQLTFPEVLSSKVVPSLPEGIPTWADRWPELAAEAPYKLLPRIEGVMLDAFRTEVLQRAVTNVCNRFNRTVAKMEAAIENPDFWKETKQPS